MTNVTINDVIFHLFYRFTSRISVGQSQNSSYNVHLAPLSLKHAHKGLARPVTCLLHSLEDSTFEFRGQIHFG
jgi:hypothetical protein